MSAMQFNAKSDAMRRSPAQGRECAGATGSFGQQAVGVLSYGGGDAGRDQDQKEDDRGRRKDKRQGLRLVLSRDGLQPVKMLPLHLLRVMGFFQ